MLKEIQSCPPIKLGKVWRSYAVPPEDKDELNEAIAEAEAAFKMSPHQRVVQLTYRYYSERYGKFYD